MATSSSRPVVSLDTIESDLQSAVAQIMRDLTELQRTANSPQLIDQAWIIDRIKRSKLGNRYLLEPADRYGSLITLPLEVRRMIYRPLIASGHLSILRTSHAVNQEASELLFAEGVCRITYGFLGRLDSFKSTQDLVNKIQNVRVEGRLGSHLESTGVPQLAESEIRRFSSSAISRKNFIIDFEIEPSYGIPDNFLNVIRTLTGFEQVVVNVCSIYSTTEYEFISERSRSEWLERIKQWCLHILNDSKCKLAPDLGPGDCQDDCLVFHPRKI